MLTYVSLVVFCVVFVELFIALKLIKDSKSIITTSKESMAVVASKTMSDEEKERFMRRNSATVFKVTFILIVKFMLITAVLGGLYYGIKYLSLPLAEKVAQASLEWKVIIVLTAVSMIYVWGRGVILRRL